jgi:7-cyano-7-deazaguanine reductase
MFVFVTPRQGPSSLGIKKVNKRNPLSKNVSSPLSYDPGILFPINREDSRINLSDFEAIEMFGFDCWNAYELSWLDLTGKPVVGMGRIAFPMTTRKIIESKSLKLFLNSLNNEKFASIDELSMRIQADLSGVCEGEVDVSISLLDSRFLAWSSDEIGECIDHISISETLFTDLFKSNCPVTNQPDWASVVVRYSGSPIGKSELLSYLCSFRNHQGYHEECAERIFYDLWRTFKLSKLFLAMSYLRRGGLDINVYRCSESISTLAMLPRRIRQ